MQEKSVHQNKSVFLFPKDVTTYHRTKTSTIVSVKLFDLGLNILCVVFGTTASYSTVEVLIRSPSSGHMQNSTPNRY